jgi:5'-3' exonuclease
MDCHTIVDLGYVSFYRYHAAKRWWSFKDDKNQVDPWINEPQFRETLLKQYDKCLKKYTKNRNGYLAMESLDGKNWRKIIYPEYKAQRPKNSDIFEYMKFIATDFLPKFVEKNSNCILMRRPGTEADDLIALKTKELLKHNPQPEIRIITTDTDFLQLVEDDNTVTMYDATEKVKSDKPLKGMAYLKRKIIYGDTADNIKPVYKGKLCNKRKMALLESISALDLDNVTRDLFEDDDTYNTFLLNRRLIDFDMIEIN